MNWTTERIPTWALCYLINGDPAGLSGAELAEIKAWMEKAKMCNVFFPEDKHVYFSHHPAFGLPTDVMDCQCAYDE